MSINCNFERGRQRVSEHAPRHDAGRHDRDDRRQPGGEKRRADEPDGEQEPTRPARVICPGRGRRDVFPDEIGGGEWQRELPGVRSAVAGFGVGNVDHIVSINVNAARSMPDVPRR